MTEFDDAIARNIACKALGVDDTEARKARFYSGGRETIRWQRSTAYFYFDVWSITTILHDVIAVRGWVFESTLPTSQKFPHPIIRWNENEWTAASLYWDAFIEHWAREAALYALKGDIK